MSRSDIRTLETELQELRQRVEKLEALLKATPAHGQDASVTSAAAPVKEEVTPEIVLAISAAVAAFLGKRAKIRQIRLSSQTAWAMQGRATVQASHGISFVRGSH